MQIVIRFRTVLINLALMFVGTVLIALVCEALVRFLYKDQIHLMPRYHTSVQYGDVHLRRIRPNMKFQHTTADGTWEFVTNLQGFRNYENFDYDKPPGRLRIVALGDSNTQGYECRQDYTFAAIMEKYLREHGVDAEVINTGVSGFSTAEQLLLLEKEMVKYTPDFVVLGFFANDYEDNLKAGLFTLGASGELVNVKSEHVPGVTIQNIIYSIPGMKWLGENSYFYSLLFNTVWEVYKSKLTSQAREEIPQERVLPESKNFSDYEVELTSKLIQRIYSVSKSNGAELIILDIPQPQDGDSYSASVTADLMKNLDGYYDYFVTNDVLTRYKGAAPFHVPNGGRHITEFTHTLLGVNAAGYVERRIRERSSTNPLSNVHSTHLEQ